MTDEKTRQTYDKAEWHLEDVVELGLPAERAYVHIAYMFRFLVDNHLLSPPTLPEETADAIRRREVSALEVLMDEWDGCLLSEMLNEEGRKFVHYFYLSGRYVRKLEEVIPGSGSYQHDATDENHALADTMLTKVYEISKMITYID